MPSYSVPVGVPPRLGLTSPFDLESGYQIRAFARSPRKAGHALDVGDEWAFDEFSGHGGSRGNGRGPWTLPSRVYGSQANRPLFVGGGLEDVASLSAIDPDWRSSPWLVDLEFDLDGAASPRALWSGGPRDADVASVRGIDGRVRRRGCRG